MKKRGIILAVVLTILALPVAAKGIYLLLPDPPPEHFARMFEKQTLPEKFHGAIYDEAGSYWPECVNMPGPGVLIFANHGPPCAGNEIGFMNAPMRSSPIHWRIDEIYDNLGVKHKHEFLNPSDKARVIEYLKVNGMHYAGENHP